MSEITEQKIVEALALEVAKIVVSGPAYPDDVRLETLARNITDAYVKAKKEVAKTMARSSDGSF